MQVLGLAVSSNPDSARQSLAYSCPLCLNAAMVESPASKGDLAKRLSSYWKMEGANVVILPAIMVALAGGQVGPLALFALVPMCGLLLVGTLYWRAKLAQLQGQDTLRPTLRTVTKWRRPLFIATILAVLGVIGALIEPGIARSRGDFWVAFAATLLAALEYVNYYHRQLQHFDHLADFTRLFSGRGFRKSQMRRDLERAGLA